MPQKISKNYSLFKKEQRNRLLVTIVDNEFCEFITGLQDFNHSTGVFKLVSSCFVHYSLERFSDQFQMAIVKDYIIKKVNCIFLKHTIPPFGSCSVYV